MDFVEQYRLPPLKKKKMKKKKKVKDKKEESSMELEVCKKMNMNLKDLKDYFFPNNPTHCFLETIFLSSLKVIDYTDGCMDDVFANRLRSHIVASPVVITNKYCATTDLLGKYFDYRTMLSDYLVRHGHDNNRKRRRIVTPETLRGKYLLICCFSLPQFWDTVAWNAVVACSEMYSKLNGLFEMVIVPNLRPGWTHNKAVFNQFFDAFPPSCLAVPFRSHRLRQFLCDAIGVVNGFLLVSPDGIVLCHSAFDYKSRYDNHLQLVPMYGPDSTPFPFVSRTFVSENGDIRPEVSTALWNLTTPSSLEGFLSTDSVFRMIHLGGDAFDQEDMPISSLKSKLVGLYLYSTGLVFPVLQQIMDTCRQSGRELEIVLVLIPRGTCFNPWDFLQVVSKALAKHKISCWVAPFSRTASIVLEHLFEGEEKVIMVEPNAQYVEPRGVELMRIYGDCAYPFTLSSVVQNTVEQLRRLTLESFFDLLETAPQSPSPSTGKMVYFYFDYSFGYHDQVFREFERLFMGDADAVLHYISVSDTIEPGTMNLQPENCHLRNLSSGVKLCTKDPGRSRDFLSSVFLCVLSTIVAFGPDGKICSVLAHCNPSHCLPSSDDQIKENLSKEVWSQLEKFLKNYDDEEYNHVPEPLWLEEIQEARQRLQGIIYSVT